jgi:hypothetical protein
MKKLIIIMAVVVSLVVVAVAVTVVPSLCVQGGANGNCDLVSALRGGVRLVNTERCQSTPQPADCALTAVAGLK